jgi:hypothetical protein
MRKTAGQYFSVPPGCFSLSQFLKSFTSEHDGRFPKIWALLTISISHTHTHTHIHTHTHTHTHTYRETDRDRDRQRQREERLRLEQSNESIPLPLKGRFLKFNLSEKE